MHLLSPMPYSLCPMTYELTDTRAEDYGYRVTGFGTHGNGSRPTPPCFPLHIPLSSRYATKKPPRVEEKITRGGMRRTIRLARTSYSNARSAERSGESHPAGRSAPGLRPRFDGVIDRLAETITDEQGSVHGP